MFCIALSTLLMSCTEEVEPTVQIISPSNLSHLQSGDNVAVVATVDKAELVNSVSFSLNSDNGGAEYWNSGNSTFDTVIGGKKAFHQSFVLNTMDTTTATLAMSLKSTSGATIGKSFTLYLNQ